MNTKRAFLAVMVGAFMAASAGVSQAGGYMHKSKGHEKSVGQEKSMWHQMDTPYSEIETSEFGDAGVSAEFWGPVEAGTLPGTDEMSGLQDTGVDPSRWMEPDAE